MLRYWIMKLHGDVSKEILNARGLIKFYQLYAEHDHIEFTLLVVCIR